MHLAALKDSKGHLVVWLVFDLQLLLELPLAISILQVIEVFDLQLLLKLLLAISIQQVIEVLFPLLAPVLG